MKIYSDVLTAADLRETVAEVPGMYLHDITQLPKTKIRSVGWEIDTASTTRRRWKNGGNYGVRRIMAASRDDHGVWFAKLYARDPNARITSYEGVDDFHRKTFGKYKKGFTTHLEAGIL